MNTLRYKPIMEAAREPHPVIARFIEYLESVPNTIGLFLKLAYICKKEYNIELDFGGNWMYKAIFDLYVNLHDNPKKSKKEIQSFCIASHIGYIKNRDKLDLQTCNEIVELLDDWVELMIPRLENDDDKKHFYIQHRTKFKPHAFMFMEDVLETVQPNDAIFDLDPSLYTVVSVLSEKIDSESLYEWYSRSQNAWCIVRVLKNALEFERGDEW